LSSEEPPLPWDALELVFAVVRELEAGTGHEIGDSA
jgi:hypothetical protein